MLNKIFLSNTIRVLYYKKDTRSFLSGIMNTPTDLFLFYLRNTILNYIFIVPFK